MTEPESKKAPPSPKGKPWMTILPADYLRASWLGAPAKLLGCILQSYSDRGGIANPSIETLERDSNMDRRMVQRHLRELCASGFVKILSKPRRKGSPNTRYALKISGYQKCPSSSTHMKKLYDGQIRSVTKCGRYLISRKGSKTTYKAIIPHQPSSEPEECYCDHCIAAR